MAKLAITKGSVDVTVNVFIQDSTSSTGAGLTGLVYNTASLTCYYVRERGTATALSLVTLAAADSAHSDGGFKEIDATNMPGVYRLDLSDAICATGAKFADVMLKGAANMAPCILEIDLIQNAAVKKNTAFSGFMFKMLDSSDHITPKTGLTITATRSIDGGAFGACANSATEVSAGFYKIDLAAADVNGALITFKFTSTGADPTEVTVLTEG